MSHIYAEDTSILYNDSDPNTIIDILNQKMPKSNKLDPNMKISVVKRFVPHKKLMMV